MKVRQSAVWVQRCHGAYLVSGLDPMGDATSDELYTAASSLPVAKRLAREMAEALGYEGVPRWAGAKFCWTLEMVWDEDHHRGDYGDGDGMYSIDHAS